MLVWPKPHKISELSPSYATYSRRDKRKLVRIGVVDDEQFTPEVRLRDLGFDITHLGDSPSFSDLACFQILLCDLNGVFEQSSKQGAGFIKLVRDSHPTIFALAYTGIHPTSTLHREAARYAHETIKKIQDIEDWTEILDKYIDRSIEPREVWKRFRAFALDQGLDTYEVMALEHAFVRSVLKKDMTSFSKATNKLHLSEHLSTIVEHFSIHIAAHGALKFLGGV